MKCTNCGETNHAEDAVYCHGCGDELAKQQRNVLSKDKSEIMGMKPKLGTFVFTSDGQMMFQEIEKEL